MESYFSHKIFPKQKFYLQYFKGVINMDIAGRAMLQVINDEDFDPSFNTIVDVREAKMQFSADEVKEFVKFLTSRNIAGKSRKIALLTEKPNEEFYISLFKLLSKNQVTNYETFTTLEASIKWAELKSNKKRLVQNEIMKLQLASKQAD